MVGPRWQHHEIANRLREQIEALNVELNAALGSEAMNEPTLGTLHQMAMPADAFPDFTIKSALLEDFLSPEENTA